jgi:hypothetical protein
MKIGTIENTVIQDPRKVTLDMPVNCGRCSHPVMEGSAFKTPTGYNHGSCGAGGFKPGQIEFVELQYRKRVA